MTSRWKAENGYASIDGHFADRDTGTVIEDWRRDYNANSPHSAHGELTPAEFALQWTATHQPRVA